jgi:hypothetical protein
LVGGDGDTGFNAPFYQTINGLVPGNSYTLTFYQAGAQQNGSSGATTAQWQVTLGSQTQLSTLMNAPSQGFAPWSLQTMTFQAPSASEVLTFLAMGGPYGRPPVSLIDDIVLTQSTPEPAPAVLAGLAFCLLFAKALYKRRNASAREKIECE